MFAIAIERNYNVTEKVLISQIEKDLRGSKYFVEKNPNCARILILTKGRDDIEYKIDLSVYQKINFNSGEIDKPGSTP